MGQTVQYDQIGSKYDDYARTATLKRAESYTFFRMVGDLAGKHVLDLACGFGFYTRQLKQRGAAQVLGIDISPEMVRLACAKEQDDPTGVAYRVGDATDLPVLGAFDLVTAVHLLAYATSRAQLIGMFRSAYANLVAGGRFIAYTNNPAFSLSKPNCTKYGVTILRLAPAEDGAACEAEFAADPPFRVQWFQWHRAPYEWALQAGGFRDWAWYVPEVAPDDVVRYGAAYWQDFYDNCPNIGLVCQK
jgi:SAM-dependent methyltransferase